MTDAPEPSAAPAPEVLDLLRRAGERAESRDLPAAIACLERALEIEPQNVPARKRLAVLAAASGERDRAVSLWTEMLEEIPGQAHKRLARLHEEGGDLAAAIGHWQALLALPGDATLPHTRLARLHEDNDDPAAALPHLRALREYARPSGVLRVDAGGQGDLTTVRAAVDSILAGGDGARVEIQIAPGRYRERVVIPHGAPPITLRGTGERPEEVILESDRMSNDPWIDPDTQEPDYHNDFRAAALFVASDDHIVSNLALVNTSLHLFDDSRGQPAARFDGDRVTCHRVVFVNWGSDALAAVWGRQAYVECRLEARGKGTDFIYGTARALFHRCRIMVTESGLQLVAHARTGAKVLDREDYVKRAGQAATPRQARGDGGFVFSRCRFDTGLATRAFFGRPYRKDGRIVLMRSWLGEGIRPEGWTVKGVSEHQETVFFAEHDNYGPGADTSRRVDWAHQLSVEEAAEFRASRFLRGPDGELDAWLAYVRTLIEDAD